MRVLGDQGDCWKERHALNPCSSGWNPPFRNWEDTQFHAQCSLGLLKISLISLPLLEVALVKITCKCFEAQHQDRCMSQANPSTSPPLATTPNQREKVNYKLLQNMQEGGVIQKSLGISHSSGGTEESQKCTVLHVLTIENLILDAPLHPPPLWFPPPPWMDLNFDQFSWLSWTEDTLE